MKAYKLFEKYNAKIFNSSNIHNITKLITEIGYKIEVPVSKISDEDYQVLSKIELVKLLSQCNRGLIIFLIYRNEYKGYYHTDDFDKELFIDTIKSSKLDYGIVMNINELENKYGKLKDIISDRKKNVRKSNDVISKENIEKYVSILLNKYDFSTKEALLITSQNLFNMMTPMFIYKCGSVISRINDYFRFYRNLVSGIDNGDKDQILRSVDNMKSSMKGLYMLNSRTKVAVNNINSIILKNNNEDFINKWELIKNYDVMASNYFKKVIDYNSMISVSDQLGDIHRILDWSADNLYYLSKYFYDFGTAPNKSNAEYYINRILNNSIPDSVRGINEILTKN